MNKPVISIIDSSEDNSQSMRALIIDSLESLRSKLKEYLNKEPRIVDLVSSSGDRLQVGLGGQYGCAQYLKADGFPPYMCAVTQCVQALVDIEFQLGGTPTPVVPEQCLSVTEVLRIAEHFFLTGGRDPSIEWVEV